MAIINVEATVGIYKFVLNFGIPALSGLNRELTIPYTGTASPAMTAALTTYEYSLDGTTWYTMTPSSSTVTTGLSFTPTGAALTFTWMMKDDIGDAIYNKEIFSRLQATSGTLTTTLKSYTLYFPKIQSDTGISDTPPLPEDYRGINGSDLLEKAPKPT